MLPEIINGYDDCERYKGLEWADHGNPHFDNVGRAIEPSP